jgi:putative hydrolase of the HAD superfamily
MIHAVVFDLEGVYFPNGKQNFVQYLLEQGADQDTIERVFLKGDQMDRYKTGRLTDEQYWSWALPELGITNDWHSVVKSLLDGYDVDMAVAETVRSVRRNGYKTMICSNNFPARINGLQEKYGFLDDFDGVILSYEVGAVKPDPAIFKALITEAGVAPEALLYADDKASNVEAAQTLGITALVYDDFDQFAQLLHDHGVNTSSAH